jgi:hypothetical protein
VSATSPYRIAGERPTWVEPVALRVPAPPVPESDAEIETVACEYNAPADSEPFQSAQWLGGLAIGGSIAVGLTALIVAVCRLFSSG